MRKEVFSMMLCLGAVGGATVVAPVTANAAIAQAPTIKVQGQVVDETGAPLMGASIKAKNSKTGAVTDIDGNSRWMSSRMPHLLSAIWVIRPAKWLYVAALL